MSTPSGGQPNTQATEQPDKQPAGAKPGEGTEGKGGAPSGDKPPGGEETYTRADVDEAVRVALAKRDADDKRRADEAKLSEEDRLKARATAAESALREREAQDALVEAAREAGAANPLKVARLVKDSLEFDDRGKPSNVAALITTAKRDYAEEFAPRKAGGSADGGAGRESKPGLSMNDIIRRAGRGGS